MKTSEIKFKVSVDENHLPVDIEWEAADAGERSHCRSCMLAIWDHKENATLRIDLWTKEMSIEEMKKFYIQNLMSLTDTYIRATNDKLTGKEAHAFFEELGTRIGVLSKK